VARQQAPIGGASCQEGDGYADVRSRVASSRIHLSSIRSPGTDIELERSPRTGT